MSPEHLRSQRGSMLVMALFVMIVISLLGLTLVSVISSTSQSVVYEVLGTRALSAAQSGMQQTAAAAFPLNSGPVPCNTVINSPTGYSNIEGLENCSYTARCSTTPIQKNGVAHYFYRFESTGLCQAGDVWVSRSVSMDALQEQ